MAIHNRNNGMLTASQVAGLLKIELDTVSLWSELKVLKAYHNGNGDERKYKREDILSFLDRPVKLSSPADSSEPKIAEVSGHAAHRYADART